MSYRSDGVVSCGTHWQTSEATQQAAQTMPGLVFP